ncbi:MAG: T9SS type A sorting domain-containing protein [Cyclobacteriaceae bacterium]
MQLLLTTFLTTLVVSLLSPLLLHGGTTPQTISMDASTNNASAFGADGTLGTDNTSTFYAHWDATYLYIGWDGGRTNYSSDMYYVAIDVVDEQGSSSSIEGVDFDNSAPDFYAFYENNSTFHGAPASNGNAFEIWQSDGSNGWTFLSRTGGNDNTSSKITFSDGPGEVRFRVAWSTLGVTPGASQPLGLTFWNNNPSGNFAWASWPSDNPTGSTTQTMTHKLKFADTADGTNPSSDGYTVTTSTLLPIELIHFKAENISKRIHLNWKTASEINNDYFTVEKSRDGRGFSETVRIKGAGTTKVPQSYSWDDPNSDLGMSYYRLKQTDFDGTSSYSPIVVVHFSQLNSASVWPNATKSALNVQLDAQAPHKIAFDLIDLSGKIHPLKEVTATTGNSTYSLILPSLARGIYIFRVSSGDGTVYRDKVKIE